MREWHEVFVCETCRFKVLPTLINEIPPTPHERKDMFIGTYIQARKAGWRMYAKLWFCPECVADGSYIEYCIDREMEIHHYFGWMSREEIKKEWME